MSRADLKETAAFPSDTKQAVPEVNFSSEPNAQIQQNSRPMQDVNTKGGQLERGAELGNG